MTAHGTVVGATWAGVRVRHKLLICNSQDFFFFLIFFLPTTIFTVYREWLENEKSALLV